MDAEWVERFSIDGFINYGRVLQPAELASLSEHVDGMCAGRIPLPDDAVRAHAGMVWKPAPGVFIPESVWQLFDVHKHDPEVLRLCELPAIREACSALLGGPARLWSTQVILKPALHGGEVPWHQDGSYWGEAERLTCWVAIDDATPANGCMRMVPGSHRRGQLAYEKKGVEGAPLELLVSSQVDEERQVYVPVPAGCASFHHARTLHASARNTTPHRRRAIAITWERA